MKLLKKLCNTQANSLLESVIALALISICLYIAILIYTSVYAPSTSANFYIYNNKMNEFFFLKQIQNDSLLEKYENESWIITNNIDIDAANTTVKYKSEAGVYIIKTFFIADEP